MGTSKKLIFILLISGFILGFIIAYPVGHSGGVQSAYKADLIDPATDGVTIGNNKIVDSHDVALNLENTNDFSILVSLLKSQNILNTLNGSGPFTIFAPSNTAFSELTPAEKTSLTNPQDAQEVLSALNYEIVVGTYTTASLAVMAENGETLITLQGEQLTPVLNGSTVSIKDAQGNVDTIETADAISSNGVIQELSAVPLPQ